MQHRDFRCEMAATAWWWRRHRDQARHVLCLSRGIQHRVEAAQRRCAPVLGATCGDAERGSGAQRRRGLQDFAAARMLDNFDPIETSFRRLRDDDFVHETVMLRDGCNNPAATCAVVSDTGEPRGAFGAHLGQAGV